MSVTIDQTESDAMAAIRSFLVAILPPGTPVIQGQDNRVAEPAEDNFVEVTPILRSRLETNIDTYADCSFTGLIIEQALTVTAVGFGAIVVGAPVFGPTVAPGTSVAAFQGGSGGTGTYLVAPAQTVASGPLAAGVKRVQQNTEATFQLDIHGPVAADNIARITALWRDDYGCQAIAASLPGAAPLYSSEPRRMLFVNAEAQYETRWSVDLVMQINPILGVPQQFADALVATLPAPVDA